MRFEDYVLTPPVRRLLEGLTEEERRHWSALAGVDLPRPSSSSIVRSKIRRRVLMNQTARLLGFRPYAARKYPQILASIAQGLDASKLTRG